MSRLLAGVLRLNFTKDWLSLWNLLGGLSTRVFELYRVILSSMCIGIMVYLHSITVVTVSQTLYETSRSIIIQSCLGTRLVESKYTRSYPQDLNAG